MLLLLVTPV